MKKIFAFVLITALAFGACFAFFGCTSGTSTQANFEVPEGGYDGSAVTITFYHTMGQDYREVLDGDGKTFDGYIAEFNKLYPNITIEHKQVGDYDDVRNKIKTELGNGESPNIAYCYSDHVAYYNQYNAVVQLDNLINSQVEVTDATGATSILGLTDEQKSDFVTGYYEEGRQFGDGYMYMLPFSKSTELLYYNKTFFDQYKNDSKYPLPDLSTTQLHWFSTDENDHESLEYVIKTIKKIDPDSTPLGYDSESNWFITLTEQYNTPYTSATGEHYLFDNEQNRNMMKTLNEWYQSGLFTTRQMINNEYTSVWFKKPDSSSHQKTYMVIGSSAGAANQRPDKDADGNYLFDVGITTIPQADSDNKKVISQGPNICIFNKSNPQEVIASWLFVKFLTTNAMFQAEFAQVGGYMPVIESARNVEFYKSLLEKADGGNYITGLAAKLCMDQADYYFTSPAFSGSATAREEVGNMFAAIMLIKDGDIESQIKSAFESAINECRYSG